MFIGNLITDRWAESTAGARIRARWSEEIGSGGRSVPRCGKKGQSQRVGAFRWWPRPLTVRDARLPLPKTPKWRILASHPTLIPGNDSRKGLLRYKLSKLVITAIAAAAALFGVIGWFVGYSLHAPVLNLVFAPPNPSLPADAPIGTFVALVIVTTSDGSVFNGSLSFGAPYGDAHGCFTIRDRTIVLACQLTPGAALEHITITAASSQ